MDTAPIAWAALPRRAHRSLLALILLAACATEPAATDMGVTDPLLGKVGLDCGPKCPTLNDWGCTSEYVGCSKWCHTDADCPADSLCWNNFQCLRRCSTTADCISAAHVCSCRAMSKQHWCAPYGFSGCTDGGT